MAQTQPSPAPIPGIEWIQRVALLRTTLARMARYTQQMQKELAAGELNTAHARQLGQAVLTVVEQAAAISADAERTARSAA